MRIGKIAFQGALMFLGLSLVCAVHGQSRRGQTPCLHLNQAIAYQVQGDARAEAEFKLAEEDANACPKVFLIRAESASRELRFQQAAELLERYLELTPHANHVEDRKDLRNWRRAAHLKDRIDNSSRPALSELLELIPLIDAYGEKKGVDATPYAEKALQLFPDSAEAMLTFVKLRMTSIKNDEEKNRVKLLLDRAVILTPASAEAHSFRGHFYLWWLHKPVDAETEFQRALTLSDNRDTQSWKDLGYIYRDRGKKQEAINAFRTYLRLLKAKGAPVDPIVRDNIQKLEKEVS